MVHHAFVYFFIALISSILISVYNGHPYWILALNTLTLFYTSSYIVLHLLFKSSTPTRLMKRGLKQKTTYYNDGGNGDDDEVPEHHHYSSAEFLAAKVVEAI